MTGYDDDIYTEALLLRYLDGVCTPQEQAHITNDAELWQQLETLQQFDATLQQGLRPTARLSGEQLVDFAADRLDAAQALVVGCAVQQNPQLRREVDLLRDLLTTDPFAPVDAGASPLVTLADGIRQVIELFQEHRPVAVRGHALRFQGPSVSLTLRQEQVTGEDPSWIVRGLVEHEGEGQPAVVVLQSDDDISYRTLANDEGIFRFSGLKNGMYDLILLLVDHQQELRLHQFKLA